jgi:hypothetical protein
VFLDDDDPRGMEEFEQPGYALYGFAKKVDLKEVYPSDGEAYCLARQ